MTITKHNTTFDELKEKALANHVARAAYDEAEEEWKLTQLLLSAREYAQLSQTELAKRLGVSPARIKSIEGNPLNTNFKTILKYFNACNVKLNFSQK